MPNTKFQSFRIVMALILREMATTYGRSPGGYLWAILEPVGGIVLLTFVFSLAFRSPPIGTNFPIYYATGILPFIMYMDLNIKISQSIRFSKPLLFYPKVHFLDAIVARFILNTITQVMVFSLVISSILWLYSLNSSVNYQAVFLSLAMAAAFGLGVGTLNCFLFSIFPIWERLWGILNRPMFIISCILFLFESVPQPYRGYLWYNPAVHFVGEMRSAYYPGYEANYVSYLYVFALSIVFFLLGLIFLSRFHSDILNK